MAAKAMAKAPFGHAVDDPEQRDRSDRGKSARGIHESRQPIGHAKPDAAAARTGSSWIVDEQGQPVERQREAGENLGRLVGKQAQRRRARRQSDVHPHRSSANPAHPGGGDSPAGRIASHRR